MPERALARIRDGAVERNCAQLRSRLERRHAAVRGGEGRRLRPRRAPVRPRGAGRAEPTWLAVATAAEAAELRADGIGGRILVMGALTGDEARRGDRGEADVVVWDVEFLRALAARPTRRACT